MQVHHPFVVTALVNLRTILPLRGQQVYAPWSAVGGTNSWKGNAMAWGERAP